jgi:hypothetical protein
MRALHGFVDLGCFHRVWPDRSAQPVPVKYRKRTGPSRRPIGEAQSRSKCSFASDAELAMSSGARIAAIAPASLHNKKRRPRVQSKVGAHCASLHFPTTAIPAIRQGRSQIPRTKTSLAAAVRMRGLRAFEAAPRGTARGTIAQHSAPLAKEGGMAVVRWRCGRPGPDGVRRAWFDFTDRLGAGRSPYSAAICGNFSFVGLRRARRVTSYSRPISTTHYSSERSTITGRRCSCTSRHC